MNATQAEKGVRFAALHTAPGAFVFPNPWDGGSARLLAGFGFPALATSSWAAAATLGRRDYELTREEALAVIRTIAGATDLPVAADLQNGFGAAPETVAETIRLAAEAGCVGGSIEDSTDDDAHPLYDFDFAVERVHAAVEAARRLPFKFTLTARTEGMLCDRTLDEVIRRLLAFEAAGADVLFAPGLRTLEQARQVCSAVHKPVNFMNGLKGASFPVGSLAEAGVKRISLAASLYRAAMTALRDAAAEMSTRGTFGFVDSSIPSGEMSAYLR